MLRGKRTLIALVILIVLAAAGAVTVRWLLRPDNLARVIIGWVERELGAQLTLAEPPGVRLIPQLQLGLEGARVERGGVLLASAGELRVALPWSTLWSGGFNFESLSIRRPVVAWPQLMTLLGELSDPATPSQAPNLPDIAVGVRVEDGTLLSGDSAEDWRIDRISMVTTPLYDGQVFHLDAGARVRGEQSRTLSVSLRSRPTGTRDALMFDDIALRLVISPDNLPLAEGMTIQLDGSLRLRQQGLAGVQLDGRLPGWPDWLPDLLGFKADQPIALTLTLDEGSDTILLALVQGDHSVQAQADVRDMSTALAMMDRPLAAIAALRSHWSIDALSIGEVRLQGIQLDIQPFEPETPASTDDGTTGTADPTR
jgi:hypothetical protein